MKTAVAIPAFKGQFGRRMPQGRRLDITSANELVARHRAGVRSHVHFHVGGGKSRGATHVSESIWS